MKKWGLAAMLLALLAAALVFRLTREESPIAPGTELAAGVSPGKEYRRIVSMAPSATEVLFAVGAGPRVVGVTRFCKYPPEADALPEVGGFIDPSYEAIAALAPDLAAVLSIHGEATARIRSLGADTLVFEHRTLEGILNSIRRAAEVCGDPEIGAATIADIEARMERVAKRVEGLPTPKVLLSAGRGVTGGGFSQFHVAGKGQWYDDLIALAGGKNAFEDEGIMFPQISTEGIFQLNPDVIIEMAPELAPGSTVEGLIADWKPLSAVPAVRDGRVYILVGDHVTVPGPRFVQVLEDLARAIHPEVDWAAP